jgi:glucose/arabinose dehydrogenase
MGSRVRIAAIGVFGAAVLAGGVALLYDDTSLEFTGSGLRVELVADGLDHPWDVQPIGEGRLLVTERNRAALSVIDGGEVRALEFPSSEVWVSGETGLMGLEVDPEFAENRRVYTCQGAVVDGGNDVRVIAWTLTDDLDAATDPQVLLSGLPATSGRHGGCRLLIAADGDLYVGTGDAAVGGNPRNLGSLGGKTLRLDRMTGEPAPENPFADSDDPIQRYVHTFGHRNVQGIAQRSDGTLWSVEHGPDKDDEVNQLVAGGDYGWNPVPGYNESVPMTDQGLPGDQIDAAWSSGDPTIAPGGATFVTGAGWGDLEGALAMAVLKDQAVVFLSFDDQGRLTDTTAPDVLHELGRIRTVANDIDDTLLITTDNGDGTDAVYRVLPVDS